MDLRINTILAEISQMVNSEAVCGEYHFGNYYHIYVIYFIYDNNSYKLEVKLAMNSDHEDYELYEKLKNEYHRIYGQTYFGAVKAFISDRILLIASGYCY